MRGGKGGGGAGGEAGLRGGNVGFGPQAALEITELQPPV